MNDRTEVIIDGELHYAQGLMLTPYTKVELTSMLMAQRHIAQQTIDSAIRYRVARSDGYGVCHTDEKGKVCIHYGNDADELCDSIMLEQIGDGH